MRIESAAGRRSCNHTTRNANTRNTASKTKPIWVLWHTRNYVRIRASQ